VPQVSLLRPGNHKSWHYHEVAAVIVE